MKHFPLLASLGFSLFMVPWFSGCSSGGGSSNSSASYAPVPMSGSAVKAKRTKPAYNGPMGGAVAVAGAPMALFSPPAPSMSSGSLFRWSRSSAEHNTESYASLPEIPFRTATKEPLSTFSIDVDTASYANVRRLLSRGGPRAAGRGADRGNDQLFLL